jgi:hypothetical protein
MILETKIEHELMPNEMQKCCISWQTIQDVHLTIGSFVDLVKYTNSDEFKEKYPPVSYIIPKRFNQDIVKSWFSYQMDCCGVAIYLNRNDVCKS